MSDAEPVNPYMSDFEMSQWKNGGTCRIDEYTIKPKRDFGRYGYWDAPTRKNINTGWVITRDGYLATPGAAWHKTQQEAIVAVHLLIASKDDPDVFNGLSAALYGMAEAIAANAAAVTKFNEEKAA